MNGRAILLGVGLSFALLANAASPAKAANAATAVNAAEHGKKSSRTTRTLTAEESERIAVAARRHQRKIRGTLDCSHLTHQVFADAGFTYAYAPSNTIFRGMRGFKRVKKPRSGDIVVWRGHVGIVIDPAEKTFYSWHSDGASMRNYDSRYWRHRGEMRFFRYLVTDANGD